MKRLLFISICYLLLSCLGDDCHAQKIPELMYFKFNQSEAGTTPNEAPDATRLGPNSAKLAGLTIGGTGQFDAGLNGAAGASANNFVDPSWSGTYSGDFTISMWLNVKAPTPAASRYYFGSKQSAQLRAFSGGAAGRAVELRSDVFSNLKVPYTGGAITITYVYDSQKKKMYAYKDGQPVANVDVTSDLTIKGDDFLIGNHDGFLSLDGVMDEFRFYNRALDDAEVALSWDKDLMPSSGPVDAGVSSVTAPSDYCAGSNPQSVKVTVKNFGTTVIDKVSIGWEVNGVLQSPVTVQQTIDTFGGTGTNEVEVTLGTYVFTSAPVSLKAWTYQPNGEADVSNANDTLSRELRPSMSGTYTINSAATTGGTTYKTFNDFIKDLKTYGVCGPVTANVVAGSGPYVETLHITDISGTSASNVIRINGNGTTVQFGNTSTERHLMILDGAKYITVENLKFKSLSPQFGYGALLTNNAKYDSIIKCEFDISSVTSGSEGNGIVFSSSLTSAIAQGTNGSHCYIGHNRIIGSTIEGGPFYMIAIAGASDSNVIEHNTLENVFNYGIFVNNAKGTQILYNDMNGLSKVRLPASVMNINITGTVPGTKVIGNRMHDPFVGNLAPVGNYYGMRLLGSGTDTEPVIVANNAIYNVTLGQERVAMGMFLSNAKYHLIYHNTISIDRPLAKAVQVNGIAVYGTNTGTEIVNNNVNITGGDASSKTNGIVYASDASMVEAQNNNIYVNVPNATQSYYATVQATTYDNQADFRTVYPSLEVNSPSPAASNFVNTATGDLTPQTQALIASGKDLRSIVPQDINGNPRLVFPTIGAFELKLTASNDAAAKEFMNPKGSYCADSQVVRAVIYNSGINDINSVRVNWSVDGVVQNSVTYNNKLVPMTSSTGRSSDVVVLGKAFIPANKTTNIKVWTSAPNGTTDPVKNNDTITSTFQGTKFVLSALYDTICTGTEAQLALSPNSGYRPGEIEWQYSENGSSWKPFSNSDKPAYVDSNMLKTRYYRVNVKNGDGCYSDTFKVFVGTAEIVSTTPGLSCSLGERVTISAVGSPGTKLNWYNSPTAQTSLDSGNSYTTPPLAASNTYYVAAELGNCESKRVPVEVSVFASGPEVDLGADTAFCEGDSVVLDAGAFGGTYAWSSGEATQTITVLNGGTYSVLVKDSNGCAGADTIVLTEDPLPKASGIDTLRNPDGSYTFTASNAEHVDSFSWNLGDGTTSTDSTVKHLYKDDGTYDVLLVISNECGTDTLSISVTLKEEEPPSGIEAAKAKDRGVRVYPNPAKDQLWLSAKNAGAKLAHVQVFNASGQTVFASEIADLPEFEVKVHELSSGFYYVRVLLSDGQVSLHKLQIIR